MATVSKPNLTRMTMKAIIRWEQLKGKSFSLLDYADREDVEALLYTMYCSEKYTLDVFRSVLEDKRFMNEVSSDLGKIMKVTSQFQKKVNTPADNAEANPNPIMISEIISTLIMSGMDAHYVLNEMELCDLPMYVEACKRQKKESMEETRMWTYLAMLPHIDAKKMKNGARDLIVFPWEEEEVREKAEQVMKDNEENLKKFLSGDLFDINSVKWYKRE